MSSIEQSINTAVQLFTGGRLPEAEEICRKVLEAEPKQPVALHLLGVISNQNGEIETALKLITQALEVNPQYIEAYLSLGAAQRNAGKIDEAVESYQKALSINPDFAPAYYNLGNLYREQNSLELAVDSFRKFLALNPNFAEAHFSLGSILHELGRIGEAVKSYNMALAHNANYAEAHFGLGVISMDLGRIKEAKARFQKAVSIQPDFADGHTNLGKILYDSGEIDEAIKCNQKALSINPGSDQALYNLAAAYKQIGKLGEALSSYQKAIAIKPKFLKAWVGYGQTLKAYLFLEGRENENADFWKNDFSSEIRKSIHFAITEFYLDSFRPHQSEQSFHKAVAALPEKADEKILISPDEKTSSSTPDFSNKLVTLLHFGRSGSGLFHSLMDGHPQISTLPSIYFHGFFNAVAWDKITCEDWRELPERFADEFEVLFDANSPKPVPGHEGEGGYYLGKNEGMNVVGENRDEVLSVDRSAFCAEARRLMEGLDSVDPGSFFLIIHAAYEKALGRTLGEKTIFYHIHNPGEYARLNFYRYAPDARQIMMVREPLQSCESWSRLDFEENNYCNVVRKIYAMLFTIDRVEFRLQDSIGVRLEDLQARPEATMKALCEWLEIEESSSLYQMTAQGKKWWGDPSSPDYKKKEQMAAFDSDAIKRPVGRIFSEKDQFVLRTLYYPFLVRFGYTEPDPTGFIEDLQKIRPMFDDLLDFEKTMMEKSGLSEQQFKLNGCHALFRAALLDRWNVLNELGDYPNIIAPLNVT